MTSAAILAATTEHSTANESYSKNRGLFSTKTTETTSSSQLTRVEGSSVSGNTVTIQAGDKANQTGDINLVGSNISSQGLTTLLAGRDLNVTSAEQSSSASSFSQTTRQASGLGKALGTVLSSSALVTGLPTADLLVGAALLTKKNGQSQAQQTATQAISSTISVGSLVTDSGRDTTVQASTVVADGAIAMHAGRNMSVLPGENTQTEQTAASSKTSGFVGDLWQPAIGTVKQSNDGKLVCLNRCRARS